MAAPTSYSVNRYVRDALDVTQVPVASGYQVNVGDLMLQISGKVYAANQYAVIGAWNSGNEIQNWSGARSEFLGVSLGQNNSYSVVSGTIPVALCGTFQYPAVLTSGTTYQPGTFVSFTQADQANTSNSGYFASQALMQCSGQATAIGKVVESLTPVASGTGLLTVYLQSTIGRGTIANT